jgi:hypothetical protein
MRFEFLPAFKGDCFLIHGGTEEEPVLILVDGGPPGTYEQHLRPRLMTLREERELDDYTPLIIDLVIVSHVDDDHIDGIIGMFQEMREHAAAGDTPLFQVRGLWHNSFDEIIGNNDVGTQAAQFGAASFGSAIVEDDDIDEVEAHDAALILQSVKQGHELRDLANSVELQIPINAHFGGGLIMTRNGEVTAHEFGGVRLTVVGPRYDELKALEKTHDKWLRDQEKKGKPVTPGSLLQSLTDESVANLSSIVLLAERDGKTALLTGDARSDFVLKGLEEIGLVTLGGTYEVGLLKMPHHGSDRNVDEDFLKRVTAPAYLFTGNGEHGNPERATFEMLARARPGAAMDFYLTYSIDVIDDERKREYDGARRSERAKQAAGRLKPPKTVRTEWSDAEHSVGALRDGAPANVRFIEPEGPIVTL